MKLLFVHGEEKLKEDKDGNFYTGGSYSQEVWNRYLTVFRSLTAIFRKELTIYEPEYSKQRFQFFNRNKINFIEIPDMTSSYASFFNFKKRKNMHHIIEEAVLDNDCLIARLPSSAGYIAIEYAEKYNKPYLIEVVGCPWDSLFNHSYKGKIIALPSYLAMKKAVKNASYAIYVTSEFLQRRYPCRGKTIGCSDVSLPESEGKKMENRMNKIKYMTSNRPIIIGTSAAVNVRYKGQEYVIKAISKLNNEGYNFEYHLAGSGDNSYLMSIAERYDVVDKVKFLGSIPHEKVFEYLDNIDIYIQPSKQEGLPRALVEAMSSGCPAMGSTTGGIPELLNDEFIFRNGAVSKICDLLKKMDQNTMLEEANRSFEKAKEYGKDLLDKKRTDFYKEFAKSTEMGKHNSVI